MRRDERVHVQGSSDETARTFPLCRMYCSRVRRRGGAQSAGPVPSVPVKTDAETPTFELWFIKSTGGACCVVGSTTRTAEELGIPHVGADFAVGPHLIATLVEAWLAGPSSKEAAPGFGTVWDFGPGGRLLGVSIENGIVTLDLSSEFSENRNFVGLPGLFKLGSVVYTVTQFPGDRRRPVQARGPAATGPRGKGLVAPGHPPRVRHPRGRRPPRPAGYPRGLQERRGTTIVGRTQER